MSSNATISIIWDPPFSLNLTTAEPDIKYCVDVYNATADECNNTAELLSECFTETIYFFSPLSPNSEQIYCFKITSSSNVLDSLNRTMSKPVTACGYTLSSKLLKFLSLSFFFENYKHRTSDYTSSPAIL